MQQIGISTLLQATNATATFLSGLFQMQQQLLWMESSLLVMLTEQANGENYGYWVRSDYSLWNLFYILSKNRKSKQIGGLLCREPYLWHLTSDRVDTTRPWVNCSGLRKWEAHLDRSTKTFANTQPSEQRTIKASAPKQDCPL